MFETVILPLLIALWPIALAVAIALLLEWRFPWRQMIVDRLRWLHAAILFIVGTIITNLIAPLGLAGVALAAQENGWGLLNTGFLPAWLSVLVGIVVLDMTSWVAHWTMHHSPILWRMHRVHHSDTVIDTSTAFRFHPAEVVYRFAVQAAVVMIFGIPVLAIAISAVLIIIFDVWEHANARTPKVLRSLAGFIITPDFHRIHHSCEERHQNSNLGTILPVWDRLFGSYIAPSELNDETRFGLGVGKQHRFDTLADLLIDPARKTENADELTSPFRS